MVSPDNNWVLVQTSHWTKTKDIWGIHVWRTYGMEGSDQHHPNQWDLVAESADIAELQALGNLLEGCWVTCIGGRK